MFSVLHSTDFYLWIEYGAPKMIKKGQPQTYVTFIPF